MSNWLIWTWRCEGLIGGSPPNPTNVVLITTYLSTNNTVPCSLVHHELDWWPTAATFLQETPLTAKNSETTFRESEVEAWQWTGRGVAI